MGEERLPSPALQPIESAAYLPADPLERATGFLQNNLDPLAAEAWMAEADFTSRTGRIEWRTYLAIFHGTSVGVARLPVVQPRFTRIVGENRYVVAMRPMAAGREYGDIPEPNEPLLIFSDAEWEVFILGVKGNEFNSDRRRMLEYLERRMLKAAAADHIGHSVIEGASTAVA